MAILVEDLPGAPPPGPWRRGDLALVSDAIREVRPVLDATNIANVLPAQGNSPIFETHWRELEGCLYLLDPWWATHHDALAEHAQHAHELIAGNALLHWDIRADNVVLTADRTVLIDWGQVRRGAAWMDHALLALDCSMSGSELSTGEFARTDPTLRERDPSDMLALTAAVAMSFAARSTQPAPQNIPTMPATRARWADALRPYLTRALERLG